ncbi:MAG: hypothetical protein VB126_01125 [Paludibacter sp.]|nr:hypothetical protein [Paludibacter sp.]
MKMRLLHSLIFISLTMQIAVGQTQYDLIEKAYKKKSIQMLSQFFDNWSIEISPNNSVIKNDTIKEVYNVFKEFYKPTQLSLLGGSEWGNSIYLRAKYFVVQSKLKKIYFADKVYFTDKELDSLSIVKIKEHYKNDSITQIKMIQLDNNGHLDSYLISAYGPTSKYYPEYNPLLKDSINEFYPQIDYFDKKAVYLTTEYQKLLEKFLGDSHSKLGSNGIMNPARSKGESKKRKTFIDNLITTFYGHWGGYWQLNTYPYINSITFDKEMKYAKVEFRMVYEGGEALLKKEGEKWIIINSHITWIE